LVLKKYLVPFLNPEKYVYSQLLIKFCKINKKKHSKTLKVFFLLILSSVIMFAQDVAKKEEVKPVIEFESTVHDFGKIYQGKPAVCEFVFINKGKVPLVLSNVQPGCGCTTPEWPREPIMPGQKAKIKAIYNQEEIFYFGRFTLAIFSIQVFKLTLDFAIKLFIISLEKIIQSISNG
jgi:hypothetical protein